MNVFENPVLVRGLAIASSGVMLGLLISVCRGLGRLVWKYKQEAASVPIEELLPAIGMAFTPVTKLFYAFVATMVLSQQNLPESELSTMSTLACGVFAVVAVVQGALAAKLINTPTAKEGLVGTFQFKMAILGVVETLAVFALVGTIIVSARLSV